MSASLSTRALANASTLPSELHRGFASGSGWRETFTAGSLPSAGTIQMSLLKSSSSWRNAIMRPSGLQRQSISVSKPSRSTFSSPPATSRTTSVRRSRR